MGDEVPEAPEGISEPLEQRFSLRGRSLRQHAARGVLINSAFQIGLAGFGLLQRFAIAAFLSASEFGFWGLLITTLITLTWLKQVGISDKYIQQDEADQVAAFQKAFTISLAYTLVFYVVVLAAVPLYGLVIYGRSEILAPALVLSLALLASAFTSPIWIAYRRMQFVRQRVLQSVDPVVSTVVVVTLVAAGMTYWGLVIGTVVGSVAAAIVAMATCPYPIRLRYVRGTLTEYFTFSWPLFIQSLSGLLAVQGAIIVGNWTVGLAGIGAIGLTGLFTRFIATVDGIISRTMYPAVCAVKDRTGVLFETFVKSNRIGLMWGLPFGIGLFLFGPDLVDHVLGERWRVAEPLLQAFGLILAFQQVAFNWGIYMRAVNRTKPLALNALLTLAIFLLVTTPLMFALGLTGYVIGIAVDVALTLGLKWYFMSRLFVGFNLPRHMWRAFAPTLPAVALVLAVRALEDVERTLGLAIAELTLFVAATALATWALERTLLGEAIGYLRGRARAPASAEGREALVG